MINKEIIKKYIEKANPWWNENFKLNLEIKEREIYKEIERYISTKQIISLTGLRRVGKTTLMFKLLKQRLEIGIEKINIFYFSFDEFFEIRLFDLIEIYEELTKKLNNSEKYFFFFDEIQKIKNWSEQIKAIYDLNPNIKFFISGSESLFIRRKSKESLAGRIYEFKISPLSFKEFLEFRNFKLNNLFLQREEIIKNFKQFLLTNGFPEIINVPEEESRKYMGEGIIDKILFRDLLEVFDVTNLQLARSIFNVIYNNPGQLIEIQELSKELGAPRQTISNYLEYLEQSFLIKKLYNYSRNARKTERRLKKYYSTLINPLLIENNFPMIFEQFVVIQLDAEFFWRDSYKNEVDIVKTDPLTAIEVKSGEIKQRDLSPIKKFTEQFSPIKSFIISYNIEKETDNIKIIPFYKYFL